MIPGELTSIVGMLRILGDPGIDDEYISDLSLWTNGLVCPDALPIGFKTVIACYPLEGDDSLTVAGNMAKKLTAEHEAAGTGVTIRFAWPLDLFKARLEHLNGTRKQSEFDHPNAKIFVLGSAFLPAPGHPALDDVPNILCVRTAEKQTFLEPVDLPETWRSMPGRSDFVLLAVIMPKTEDPT